MRLVWVGLCLSAGLFAQIGRYPGGQYPGGGGIPFPFPRRGKSAPKDTPETLSKFGGTLRRIDEHALSMETDDGRAVEIKRQSKTRYYKDSAAIDPAQLKTGDRVTVEASEDREGYLYAVNVYLEKAAAAQADAAPAPPPPEDDPDRPRLRRGIPPPSAQPTEEEAGPAAPAAPAADPLIGKARDAAATFGAGLPAYVVQEFMARYASMTRPVDWKALDVVSAEVVYEGLKERYRNVQLNGKATNKSIEQIGGSWSTGEFGSILLDLFAPSTAAGFQLDRESAAAGVSARVYGFEVDQPHSHWHVQAPAQSINPGYRGSVWIDPKTGRVLRIEMQARRLPEGFPLDTVETAVDYGSVRIGTEEFLLPVHAETLSCERGTSNCARNVIDFRNYHKYGADSSVTFGQ